MTATAARTPKRTFVSPNAAASFAGVLLLAYCAGIMLGPFLDGHDTYISFSHVEIWANALKAGDLFPVWTPGDANGFGSPVPFFYHKLFNLVAAALTLATGDVVTGFRLAILAFSTVMFYGIYRCAAQLDADRSSRIVIAIACVVSPYALVCLAERGAVAEYSAMALIPLGISLTIDLLKLEAKTWPAVKLLMLLILLALAHLVTFLAATGMLLIFALYLLWKSPARGMVLLAVAGGALLTFGILIYVPFATWGAYFCPAQARLHGLPAENAVAPLRIFSPNPGSWFAWPVSALLLGLALQCWYRKDRRATLVITLGLSAFILLLLMTRLAAPLWRSTDLLDFVQFPWRLLSITTPMIFVAFAGMIEQLPPTAKRYMQIGLLTVTVLNTGGLLLHLERVFTVIPLGELRHEIPSTGPGPDAGGEYFPARYQGQLAATPNILAVKAGSILPARRALVEGMGGCTFQPVSQTAYFRTLEIDASCESAGVIRVNQFYTPFLDAKGTSTDGATSEPVRDVPFIELPLSRGKWAIQIRERTYLELVAMAWKEKFAQAGRD
jgi:hypothetical protein